MGYTAMAPHEFMEMKRCQLPQSDGDDWIEMRQNCLSRICLSDDTAWKYRSKFKLNYPTYRNYYGITIILNEDITERRCGNMERNSNRENDYNLCELAEQVKSKDDFIRYVKWLSEDFEKHPDEWQNMTIPDFLTCMAAWVYDYSACPGNDINWDAVHYSELARILYMGKIYE